MSAPRRLPTIAPYDLPQENDLPVSRADWRPDPARAALLVHDMQRYFLAAFAPDAAPLAPLTANVAALLAAARARGMPVSTPRKRARRTAATGVCRPICGARA